MALRFKGKDEFEAFMDQVLAGNAMLKETIPLPKRLEMACMECFVFPHKYTEEQREALRSRMEQLYVDGCFSYDDPESVKEEVMREEAKRYGGIYD